MKDDKYAVCKRENYRKEGAARTSDLMILRHPLCMCVRYYVLRCLFEQRIAEFKMTVDFPCDNSGEADQEISCAERTCQTAYHADNHHSNAHRILSSLS